MLLSAYASVPDFHSNPRRPSRGLPDFREAALALSGPVAERGRAHKQSGAPSVKKGRRASVSLGSGPALVYCRGETCSGISSCMACRRRGARKRHFPCGHTAQGTGICRRPSEMTGKNIICIISAAGSAKGGTRRDSEPGRRPDSKGLRIICAISNFGSQPMSFLR